MSSGSDFKRTVFDRLAAAGAALSDPRRVAILDLVSQGPKTVEAVAAEFDCSLALASHHLRTLKRAGLAEDRRSGRYVRYSASGLGKDLWRALSHAGERHILEVRDALDAFFDEKVAVRPTPADDLLRRAEAGDVLLIDVRPRDEFEAGHLPGAVSIPIEEIRVRLATLPRNRKIVAYCRGPYCVLSHEAVSILRRAGLRAFRMAEGVLDGMRTDGGGECGSAHRDGAPRPGGCRRRTKGRAPRRRA